MEQVPLAIRIKESLLPPSQTSGRVSNSPFLAIAPLLRLFCLVGIIPATLSPDAVTFKVRCCHYLKVVAFVTAWFFIAVNCFIVVFSEDEQKSNTTVSETETYNDTDTGTDAAVKTMDHALSYTNALVVMVVNYVSFGQAYRITTLMAHNVGVSYRGPGPILRHHFLLLALYLSRSVITWLILLEQNAQQVSEHPVWFLVGAVNEVLYLWFAFSICAVPELVIGRLLQTLTSTLSDGLDEVNKRRIEVGEFCSRVDLVRIIYGKLGKERIPIYPIFH